MANVNRRIYLKIARIPNSIREIIGDIYLYFRTNLKKYVFSTVSLTVDVPTPIVWSLAIDMKNLVIRYYGKDIYRKKKL